MERKVTKVKEQFMHDHPRH